jgi:ribosome assembly protein RRB1
VSKFVYRPGFDTMNEDEKLDYDSTTYSLLHRMRVDWPCLSFDVLPDQLGAFRNKVSSSAEERGASDVYGESEE